MLTYIQRPLFQKPPAFSLLLLPTADKFFPCQWSTFYFFVFTDKQKACQESKYLDGPGWGFQCWQAKSLSVPSKFNENRQKYIKFIHWQAKSLSVQRLFNFFFMHWQAFCLSVDKKNRKIGHWQAKSLSAVGKSRRLKAKGFWNGGLWIYVNT